MILFSIHINGISEVLTAMAMKVTVTPCCPVDIYRGLGSTFLGKVVKYLPEKNNEHTFITQMDG
jgi:hypothetical protein